MSAHAHVPGLRPRSAPPRPERRKSYPDLSPRPPFALTGPAAEWPAWTDTFRLELGPVPPKTPKTKGGR